MRRHLLTLTSLALLAWASAAYAINPAILGAPLKVCTEGLVAKKCKAADGTKVNPGSYYCSGTVGSDPCITCTASLGNLPGTSIPFVEYRPQSGGLTGYTGTCSANQLRVGGTAAQAVGAPGFNWLPYARSLELGMLDRVTVALPVLTAAQQASDATATAIRLDFPEITAAGQRSNWSGNNAQLSVRSLVWPQTFSCEVKGVAGVSDTGTEYLGLWTGTNITYTACAFTSASWTRCAVTQNVPLTATSWKPYIGPDSVAGRLGDAQPTTQAARSILVGRCMLEIGVSTPSTYADPTVPNYDTLAVPAASVVGTDNASGSFVWTPSAASDGFNADQPIMWSGPYFHIVYRASVRKFEIQVNNARLAQTLAQTFVAGAPQTITWRYNQGTPNYCIKANADAEVCGTGAYAAPTFWPLIYVGNLWNWTQGATISSFAATPGTVPTWSTSQTVVSALGDSLTLGAACSTSGAFPAQLATQLGGGYTVTNDGQSGKESSEILDWWHANRATGNVGIVTILMGTNHILHGGTAEESLRFNVLAAEEVAAKGGHPMLLTVTPWYGYAAWTASQETERVKFNQLLTAYAASRGFVLVDLATDMSELSPPRLKAAYDYDHLHWKDGAGGGCTRAYQLVYAAGQAAGYWP